jgi:hypothetical protein
MKRLTSFDVPPSFRRKSAAMPDRERHWSRRYIGYRRFASPALTFDKMENISATRAITSFDVE